MQGGWPWGENDMSQKESFFMLKSGVKMKKTDDVKYGARVVLY